MEDLIIGGDDWLGEILVAIFNCVGDLNSTGLILKKSIGICSVRAIHL